MKKTFSTALAILLCFTFVSQLAAQQDTETPAALNFTMTTLDGDEVDLSKYTGKVVMFVNVASKCGLTPQYKQLQALHEKYAEQGLAIVGVPCRQFGGQEFEENGQIAEFCQENYGVEFDMMARVDVNGDTSCDLYKHLTALEIEPAGSGRISWNFEKFILNRAGEPIARFSPRTKPSSDDIVGVIEKAIAERADEGGNAPYAHQSEKTGKTYYLYSKDVELKNSDKTNTIYFFARNSESEKGEPVNEVPTGYMVSETKSGMLVLKKSQ